MSLFRQSLRPSPMASEEAIGRYLTAIAGDLEPDPLFRRRLRGVVVNRFVAAREGLAQPVPRPSRMGMLGRACLYATFLFAISVGGVMAASRGALPGDLLYPVKIEIEALRLRALPAHFHGHLEAYALSERIHELTVLTQNGDWEHAAMLSDSIARGWERLDALGVTGAPQEGVLGARLEVLDALVERLPVRARSAIDRAMGNAPGLVRTTPTAEPGEGATDATNSRANGRPQREAGVTAPDPGPVPVDAEAEVEERPSHRSTPARKESPTPEPSPSPAEDDASADDNASAEDDASGEGDASAEPEPTPSE